MSILFSPIGTADPMTQLGDGPMLHIVRHYNPDKVVLFFSKKMLAYQHQYELYTKSIELLSKHLNRPIPQIEIVESNCDEVFKFDVYISEFEDIIKSIDSSGEPIIVNTSSGTPGMSQALVALGSFGRLNLTMFQVITPRRDTNQSCDREKLNDWNLELLNLLWDCNPDNDSQTSSRIVQVGTPNFSEQLLRENIVKLISAYEYDAAYLLCNQSNNISDEASEMIRAAGDRLNLDGQLPSKVFGGTELCFHSNDLLCEYLYIMEVRLKQGHWADFMRSMSPALTEVMKQELAPLIKENTYNMYNDGRPTNRYNLKGIQEDKRLSKIFPIKLITAQAKDGKKVGKYITNDSYWSLVKEFCTEEDKVKKINCLRNAEINGRNALAHNIKPSPKSTLDKVCGISMKKIMEWLFELYGKAEPGLYDRINKTILEIL